MPEHWFLLYLVSMMSQLRDSIRVYFPAILTRKYACDLSIIFYLLMLLAHKERTQRT